MQLLRFHYRKLFFCIAGAAALIMLVLHVLTDRSNNNDNYTLNSAIRNGNIKKMEFQRSSQEYSNFGNRHSKPEKNSNTVKERKKSFDIPVLGDIHNQINLESGNVFEEFFHHLAQVSSFIL